jgi:hypothetical protein
MKKHVFAWVSVLVASEAQAATLNFVGHPLLERSGTSMLGRAYDLEILYGAVMFVATVVMVGVSASRDL